MTMEYCATLTGSAVLPMTTYTQECAACGRNGSNTITLAVPQAVVAGTASGHVVAITVQTVIPVLAHNTNTSSGNNYSSPGVSAVPIPAPLPVVGAGASSTALAGFIRTLGYGLGLWMVVFGIGILL